MIPKLLPLSLLFLATPVLAHSPYLKPNQFQPDARRDHITVEASFSEDDLRPDIAMTADKWHATAPDGATVALTPAAALKDATFLEVPLTQEGTYRISTGVRQGRVAKAAIQGTTVRFLEPGEKPWPSEKLIDVQSVTRADVFVTHGKPTAVPAPESDLEIAPVTRPADAYTRNVFQVRVLDAGKPVVGEHDPQGAGKGRQGRRLYRPVTTHRFCLRHRFNAELKVALFSGLDLIEMAPRVVPKSNRRCRLSRLQPKPLCGCVQDLK